VRVVSLACSNTEIICALGCGHLLVGVDDHSDRPADVLEHLPRVGPDLQIDIGKVASLEPDLVCASLTVPGHERVVEGLERAGLPYVAPEPTSLNDVYANVRLLANALGVPERGEALAREMETQLSVRPSSEHEPTLLVQWWPRPVIVPGRLSWVTDLIEAAGGRNPLGHEHVKSRPLSDKEVRDLDPDAIILAWCGVEFDKYRPDIIYRNEAWQGMKALERKQVYCVPEAFLGRPGPGLLDGLHALTAIVRHV
jgi:iron complex transport system substrate-binding protein